jgi:hypothetical protein
MAFVVCPEHGGHGAAAVCAHVASRLLAKQAITDRLVPVKASYAGTTLGPTWLCPKCAERFHVPSEGMTFDGDEGLERYWSEIDWSPVCRFCLDRGRTTAD